LKRKFEVVAGPCIACYLKRAHCKCNVIIARISHGMFPAHDAIFLLALDYTYTAVGNTFVSHSCTVRKFVELRNIEMPQEVVKIS